MAAFEWPDQLLIVKLSNRLRFSTQKPFHWLMFCTIATNFNERKDLNQSACASEKNNGLISACCNPAKDHSFADGYIVVGCAVAEKQQEEDVALNGL